MTSSAENFKAFFQELQDALEQRTFVKLTLSKPASGLKWKKIVLTPFQSSKNTLRLGVEYFTKTQTERRNIPYEDALSEIESWLPNQLSAAHLRCLDKELTFEKTSFDSFRLKRMTSTRPAAVTPDHNRQKHYIVPDTSEFLRELRITSPAGQVRREMYDKFRQIQKFTEIISGLLPESLLKSADGISAVDFGSGKNYLTFALHHLLSGYSGRSTVTGVEQRADLAAHGQEIAQKLGLSQLQFIEGTIANFLLQSADLVVALHACNTASDDALAMAIRAQAKFICIAPCCHSYVRKVLTPSSDLQPMLRHGIIEERFAEGLTDSLRVLVLEALGYKTKLFEFISLEHTAKNVMITAQLTGQKKHSSRQAIDDLKEKFKLPDFYLDKQLADLLG